MRSKLTYLCEDYNIGLFKITLLKIIIYSSTMLFLLFLFQKITLLTRICYTRSSLIDNFYTNTMDKGHTSGILSRPISDHQIFLV